MAAGGGHARGAAEAPGRRNGALPPVFVSLLLDCARACARRSSRQRQYSLGVVEGRRDTGQRLDVCGGEEMAGEGEREDERNRLEGLPFHCRPPASRRRRAPRATPELLTLDDFGLAGGAGGARGDDAAAGDRQLGGLLEHERHFSCGWCLWGEERSFVLVRRV